MTNQTGTFDRMYVEWAEIVMKLFRRKILEMEVWETGSLYNSLVYHVITQANGDVARIEFFFNYYGRFVNRGHGRDIWIGNPGDVGHDVRRKPKPWYSKVFYGNLNDLARLVAQKYGEEAAKGIASIMSTMKEQL